MNVMQQFFGLYNPKSYLCVGTEYDGSWNYEFKKAEDIAKTDYSNRTNVFFTPNVLGYRTDKKTKKPTIWRDREHLQELSCLYVDIDFKDAEDIITANEFMEYARYHILDYEVPEPTMINSSGHGVHMYWVINPVSYRGNIEKWERVQQYIYEVFKKFGADKNVCDDRVRLLRMCDTINKKEGQAVRATNIAFSGIVYDFDAILKEYVNYNIVPFKKKSKKEKTNVSKNTSPMPTYIFSRLYQARVKDLENLLLNHRDYKSSGRENILFLYRYYQCHLLQDAQKALERTLELNGKLSYPLTTKEVKRATKSAEKYYKGSQLNWSNGKIIDFLSINNEEMRGMSTLISCTQKIERKKQRDRKYYEAKLHAKGKLAKKDAVILRQQNIYKLVKQGKDRFEICNMLNISKTTYYADLKIINTEEWKLNYKDKKIDNIYPSDELKRTGTNDCRGFEIKPKNQDKGQIPKNSAPVIISYSAYAVGGVCDAVMPCSEKPPD